MAGVPDFVIGVPTTVSQVQQLPVEIWQWSMERGDANVPSRMIILLRVKDENGVWREDINAIRVEIVDDMSTNPLNRVAMELMNMVLDAQVVDSPLANQFGITGQSVNIAGRAILANLGGLGQNA